MNKKICMFAMVALMATSVAQAGPAVALIEKLDAGDRAMAVSNDGNLIVTQDTLSTYLCTRGEGCVRIGDNNGIVDISGDGSTIVSTIPLPGGGSSAARWLGGEDWEALENRPAQCGNSGPSSGYGVSDDGSVITGLGWDGCVAYAFKYTDANGMVQLGSVPRPNGSSESTRGNTVSGDGSYIGGWQQDCQRVGAIWHESTPGTIERVDPNNCRPGEVWAMSTDASWIAGYSPAGPAGDEAYRYDRINDIIEPIGHFAAGSQFGDGQRSEGISDDGNTVVGWSGGVDVQRAWIWTPETGQVGVRNFLVDIGISKKSIRPWGGFSYAMDITPDGTVVVGEGINGAFWAHLGHQVCHRGETIRVKTGRVYARHLKHGDFDGPCP